MLIFDDKQEPLYKLELQEYRYSNCDVKMWQCKRSCLKASAGICKSLKKPMGKRLNKELDVKHFFLWYLELNKNAVSLSYDVSSSLLFVINFGIRVFLNESVWITLN